MVEDGSSTSNSAWAGRCGGRRSGGRLIRPAGRRSLGAGSLWSLTGVRSAFRPAVQAQGRAGRACRFGPAQRRPRSTGTTRSQVIRACEIVDAARPESCDAILPPPLCRPLVAAQPLPLPPLSVIPLAGDYVRLSAVAVSIVDTPIFQRLRYLKQLGTAGARGACCRCLYALHRRRHARFSGLQPVPH